MWGCLIGKIFLSFSERVFDIIFKSTFKKEMVLQFWMNLLSLSFSSTRLMIKYTFSLASNTEFTKISLGSFQNVSENSFVNPSLPGDVSFCILFRELYKHFLVKSS